MDGRLCVCVRVSVCLCDLSLYLFTKFVSKNLSGCFGADTWTDPLGVLQFVLGGTEYPRYPRSSLEQKFGLRNFLIFVVTYVI